MWEGAETHLLVRLDRPEIAFGVFVGVLFQLYQFAQDCPAAIDTDDTDHDTSVVDFGSSLDPPHEGEAELPDGC